MIVITGASRNVGKYLFDNFRADGMSAIGTFNSSFEGLHNRNDYYKVNISDFNQVRNWVSSILDRLEHIILINCAGISYNSFAHKADIEKWHRVIDVNVKGTFNVIHEFLPLMREQGYGRIINISSVVGKLPTPGVSAYAASKSAMWGMSRSLAIENATKGITVNCINLGYVNIGMGVEEVPAEYREKIMMAIPARRFCRPKEIMNTVKYLIDTEYVNGAEININGGII